MRRCAARAAARSTSAPVVLADAGVEAVNAEVDELIDTDVLRRLLAFTEPTYSDRSLVGFREASWLVLHGLESVATIRRLVAFYFHEHNHVLPHTAFGDRRRTRCTFMKRRVNYPRCIDRESFFWIHVHLARTVQ